MTPAEYDALVLLLRECVRRDWTAAQVLGVVESPRRWTRETEHAAGHVHDRAGCDLCIDDGTVPCLDCACVPAIDKPCDDCECHAPRCSCGAGCDSMTARRCDRCAKSDADHARVDAARDA